MIKGLYSSAAGMQPRMLRLEVIGNNLANLNTTGFKRDDLFFEILKERGVDMAKGKGELSGINVKQFIDFSPGSLKQTNNQLDLTIVGDGFFAVETPQGVRYTRNGNFMLALDGSIITNQGYPVLGTLGKIQLPDVQKLSAGDITINELGEITVDKKSIATLRIATFNDMTVLKKEGSSLFMTDAPERTVDPHKNGAIIRQGFLEESNVEGIKEMIVMMELSRSFESDQKAMQAQNATLERAMEVGRIT